MTMNGFVMYGFVSILFALDRIMLFAIHCIRDWLTFVIYFTNENKFS